MKLYFRKMQILFNGSFQAQLKKVMNIHYLQYVKNQVLVETIAHLYDEQFAICTFDIVDFQLWNYEVLLFYLREFYHSSIPHQWIKTCLSFTS